MEEEEWRLKSKSLWLKAGDKNTTFFHNTTRIKRIKNHIDRIKDSEGKEVRGQEEIKKEAFRYYKNLLSSSAANSEYEEFLQHTPKKISDGENSELTKEVEEKEVDAVIWDLHPDKAPGLDGFPISFYKNNWSIINKRRLDNNDQKCFGEIQDRRIHKFLLPRSNSKRTKYKHF